MQYASFTGFLETVFIILAVLMIARYFTRVFMPYILRFLVKKSEEHINKKFQGFQGGFEQQSQQNTRQTTTDKNQRKKEKEVVGEYIDFEEID